MLISFSSALVPIAWAIFAGAALLSVTLGAILAYHWFRYSMNPAMAFTAFVTFAAVTGLLLAGVLGAAIAIHVAY